MDGIGLAQQPHDPPIHPDQRNIKCQIAIIVLLWATVLAFLAGFLILVAKIKFVRKVLAAKVDVNIFNHTLALCLIASGKQEREKRFSAFIRCRHNAFPSSYSLAPRQQLWRGSKLKILCQITFRNISNLD